jgi:hypothetical protein
VPLTASARAAPAHLITRSCRKLRQQASSGPSRASGLDGTGADQPGVEQTARDYGWHPFDVQLATGRTTSECSAGGGALGSSSAADGRGSQVLSTSSPPGGRAATNEGLQGLGVGGAAEDDQAGQPVAAPAWVGDTNPTSRTYTRAQRLVGVADRAGDELGHGHRDRAPDRGGQELEPAVAGARHRRTAGYRRPTSPSDLAACADPVGDSVASDSKCESWTHTSTQASQSSSTWPQRNSP